MNAISGSAVFATSLLDLNIDNVTFTDNQAVKGGALYIKDILYNTNIQDSTFFENRANQGGAIYGEYIKLTLKNTEF